jgi:predicted Co/Zn/Cd cation transporter (cation efflux family)
VLILILVLLSLPIPYKILKDNLREVLIMAPSADLVKAIETSLGTVAEEFNFKHQVIRIQKYGRQTYINLYAVLDENYPINTVNTLDDVREKLQTKMEAIDSGVILDVVFTGDLKWAGVGENNFSAT